MLLSTKNAVEWKLKKAAAAKNEEQCPVDEKRVKSVG